MRSGSFSFEADNELLEQSNSVKAVQKHAPSNFSGFLQHPDVANRASLQSNQDKVIAATMYLLGKKHLLAGSHQGFRLS